MAHKRDSAKRKCFEELNRTFGPVSSPLHDIADIPILKAVRDT
jgi:hypothetical protein